MKKNVFSYMKEDQVCKAIVSYMLSESDAKYDIIKILIKADYKGSIKVYTDYPLLYTSANSVDMLIKLDYLIILVSLSEKHLDYFDSWKQKLKEDIIYDKSKIMTCFISCYDLINEAKTNLGHKDLKEITSKYTYDSSINEFYNFLCYIEEEKNSFSEKEVKDFSFLTYCGLYQEISKTTILKDYSIIASREGNYLSIKEKEKTFCKVDEGSLYFELINNKLLLKLRIEDNSVDFSNARDKYSKIFLDKCSKNLSIWKRPLKMGYGSTMTLAVIDKVNLFENKVDLNFISNLLKKSKKELKESL